MMWRKSVTLLLILSIFVVVPGVWASFFSYTETIDGIVAVVNEEIITLIDTIIIQTFNLHEIKSDASSTFQLGLILDRLIAQKLVIQLTNEGISVAQEEINSHVQDIEETMGEERLKMLRKNFGLSEEDLHVYIRELLLYRKIISKKFERSIFVNLKELQAYYDQIYIPQSRKEEVEPKPMVDVLDQIEAAIKQEKVQRQVEDWLRNLRQKADIQLFVDLYSEYFMENGKEEIQDE